MPIVVKLALTVLARQDTMTCKGRDKSMDMSIYIFICIEEMVREDEQKWLYQGLPPKKLVIT